MLTYSRYGFAGRVRISVKSLNARADGNVIGHATLGVQAARSGTRIDAFVLFAALISRTIRVQHALRTTGREWIAHVITRTGTFLFAVFDATLSVRTARPRIARAGFIHCRSRFGCTLNCFGYLQILVQTADRDPSTDGSVKHHTTK